MDGGLGTFSKSMAEGEPLMNAPMNNPLVNVSSMQPQAMANMMGSPLQNGGANMMPYMQMQQAFTPEQTANSPKPYAYGGLISFAEGGMPPPQDPMAQMPPEQGAPQGALAGAQEGGDEANPALVQEIEQIFSQNMQDPKGIAQQLLELITREIEKSVSPEQKQYLQTPEGQEELKQIVTSLMEQMQGGLGQMAGAGEEGAGAPPQAPPPPGGGLTQAGV